MKHVTNDKHSILRKKSVGKKGKTSKTPETISFVSKPEHIHFLYENQVNNIHKSK